MSAIKLPKPWLSYSALSLWWRDKPQYRKRYYENDENEKSPDNVYSLFGREIHLLLEKNEKLKHVPRFSKREYEIRVDINDIPILGVLDCFAPKRRSFADYKTGIRKDDGSPRWSQVEVEKLNQLPFYSLLIEE